MKRIALALALLLLLLPAMPGGAEPEWEALLPEGYENSGWRYPVVYVPGEDAGLAQALMDAPGLDLIVVRAALPEQDALAALERIVGEVEASGLRVLPDAAHRAAAGTGAGAYLAYMAALAEESPFGAAVSVRGDLAAEDTAWLAQYGPLQERMVERRRADRGFFESIYTYMDAPAEDPWTDAPGSTDDLGRLMIGWGTGSASHEFTVRPGAFDEDFLRESAARVKDRLAARMLAGALEGALTLEKSSFTPEDGSVAAGYSVSAGEGLFARADGALEAQVRVALYDGETGDVLAEASETRALEGAGAIEGSLALDLPAGCPGGEARLLVSLLGGERALDSAALVRSGGTGAADGPFALDLGGDWAFHYAGLREQIDAAGLEEADWADWPVVQPGLANWTKGFGDISNENVSSPYGADYFDYFITGNAWYARAFTLPEGLEEQELLLSIGYIDDRCEVWVNGTRVGATGLDENGRPNGETTWAAYSVFPVDPALLRFGGENTVVVRAWNDLPYGAGGWYAGPIGLYSPEAFAAMNRGADRFLEESMDSSWAARAAGYMGVAEEEYLVYLPESYETSSRSYPTLYLLHQINSDHTSYRADGVADLLDAGAAAGLFDEMIVVVPNSSADSWWRGNWERMLCEELVPHIDGKYRTIRDARFRLTAGCSMGGQGAMGVALRHPELFSGAISFYGAFSYGQDADPRVIAKAMDRETLDAYALCFLCGNQDTYGFGACAVDLHQILREKGVEHYFCIENGGHNGAFYLPRFQEALGWTRARMYHSDAAVDGLLHGSLAAEDGALRARLVADEGVAAYVAAGAPGLSVPLRLELWRDGEAVYAAEARETLLTPEALEAEALFDLGEAGDLARGATARLIAQPFDRTVLLASVDLP